MESLNCSSCRDRIIGRRWVLANGWVCSRPGELRRLGDEAGWVSGKTGTNRRKNDWPNLILGWWNSAPCNEFIGFSLLVCLFVFFMKILGVSKSLYDIYLGNFYRYPNPRLPHPNWWCSKGILPQKVHLIQVRNYKWRILICPASWWFSMCFIFTPKIWGRWTHFDEYFCLMLPMLWAESTHRFLKIYVHPTWKHFCALRKAQRLKRVRQDK